MKYLPFISLYFSLHVLLTSCGGGSGGSGDNSIETSNLETNIAIETVSLNAPVSFAISMHSLDNHLYIGTGQALWKVDDASWDSQVIVGHHIELGGYNHRISYPQKIETYLNHAYFITNQWKLLRTRIDDDGLTGIDLFVSTERMAMGCCDFDDMAINSESLFYVQGNDDSFIYKVNLEDQSKQELVFSSENLRMDDLIATEENLFFVGSRGVWGNKTLYRYDLINSQLSIIDNDVGPYADTDGYLTFAGSLAKSDTHLFWTSNNSIFSADLEIPIRFIVGSQDIGYHSTISADQNNVYAVKTDESGEIRIIDIFSGATNIVTSPDAIGEILSFDGKLYWRSSSPPYNFYVYDAILGSVKLEESVTKITALKNGFIMLNLFDRGSLAIFNTNTATTTLIPLSERFEEHSVIDNDIYTSAGNGSSPGPVYRFPIDKAVRDTENLRVLLPEEIYVLTRSFAIDPIGDRIFTIDSVQEEPGQEYKHIIFSALLDGSDRQELFRSDFELKDVHFHNDKLYFTCLNACGHSGWVLAELEKNGGIPNPIFELLDQPTIVLRDNEVFYIADTDNYDFLHDEARDYSLFSVNVAENDSIELVAGMFNKRTTVKLSTKYLYLGETSGNGNVRISRYGLNAWNEIGAREIIAIRGFAGSSEFIEPRSMVIHKNALYYWQSTQLKRVLE